MSTPRWSTGTSPSRPAPAGRARARRSPRPRRARSSPSCASRAAAAHGARRGLHRAATRRRRRRPGRGRRPAGLGPGQRRRLPRPCSSRWSTKLPASRPRPPGAVADAVGSRVTGVEVGALLASWPQVLGQYELFPPRSTPATGRAGCCWSRPTSSQVERELERRPARLPALGVPARGDPPGAVHRGAVAARPPASARSTTFARRPPTLDPATLARAARRRLSTRSRDAVRGERRTSACSTLVADPGAAGGPRPAHRA